MTKEKTIHLKVTQEHIDKGTKCVTGSCPVALAMREHFPESYSITAGLTTLIAESPYFAEEQGWEQEFYRCPTPQAVWEFMVNYDTDCAVKPFEIDITLRSY